MHCSRSTTAHTNPASISSSAVADSVAARSSGLTAGRAKAAAKGPPLVLGARHFLHDFGVAVRVKQEERRGAAQLPLRRW